MRQKVGAKEGTKITEKGDLVVGKIVMGLGPTSLVPIDVGIIHVHGNTQIEVQIPKRSDGLVTPPWML